METLYLRFISNEKAIPSAFRITALIYRDNLYVFLVAVCAFNQGWATMFCRGQDSESTPHTDTFRGERAEIAA